jgi:predicted ATPase
MSAALQSLVLDAARGDALCAGVRLDLDAAAFEVLRILLDAGGAAVAPSHFGQDEGAARLWVSVARLNAALARAAPADGGALHVASFPGQGYQLMQANPPGQRLLGRHAELARVGALLQQHRFVTIAGPGGMGKTTLARAVVADAAARYPDGVRFIDVAVLAEGRELAGALGAALGIDHLTGDGLARLAACLRGRRMLILIDCCDHHTAVAAQAGEALLGASPGIDVLCTSREPLLARSERIVRLGPMALPPAVENGGPDAATSAAVELFTARASQDDPAGFVLDHHTLPLVCAICRAVEGVPLALELAASLVRPIGLEALARQTARWLLEPPPPAGPGSDRHRTVTDMLDWSYDALSSHEREVLEALAVFRGGFTLEAARAVAGAAFGAGARAADSAIDAVIELAGKSLVSMRPEDAAGRPRLLDLTRDYVYAKLAASGRLQAVQERHARWLRTLMDRLETDWMSQPRQAWVEMYSPWLDDILAATDWALGPGRQLRLGAYLASVGFSLGDQVGAAREFQTRVRRALGLIGAADEVPAHTLLRLNFVNADSPGRSSAGLMKLLADNEWVLRLARRSGSPMLQGASLVAIWGSPYVRGNYPAALAGARRIARAARLRDDPDLALIGQRTLAQSLHFMGRHAPARRNAELALADSERRIPLAYQPLPVQVGTSMRIILARLLWMEGAADQALVMIEAATALALSDRPSALCQALGMAAIPVAVWRGETAGAARLAVRLREHAAGHGLCFWVEWAQRFELALALIAGQAAPGSLPSLSDSRDDFAKCRDHLVTFSTGLLTADSAARCENGTVGWCAPEVLRAQALARLAADQDGTDGTAAALLRRSITLARRQGAPAWALRSAITLGALYHRSGASRQARGILEPVLALCREGAGTADLRAAHALMASLP